MRADGQDDGRIKLVMVLRAALVAAAGRVGEWWPQLVAFWNGCCVQHVWVGPMHPFGLGG
jgi:hypothetical protein